jgi:uncharacterized repeat protein (TIGR03803 family)
MLRISSKLGCGLALALLVPVGGADAKSHETVLYSFTGGADGSNPFAGLIEDKAGNFYGTSVEGGTAGDGTVFKLAPDGTETVLWSFTGADGSYPEAVLVMDKNGNLYGTTSSGGASGFGTVFEVAPGGTMTVLHTFTGMPDGKGPQAGVTMDKKGNLYGTTVFGGANNEGTVFKISPHGKEKVLWSFTYASGAYPLAGLILDTNGNLYGTTEEGGPGCNGDGCGTVFKLAPDGTETMLYSFCPQAGCTDGVFPSAGVIMDSAGNLYGTAVADGAGGNGTVFEVAPDGKETTLYSFTGADGAQPSAGLIMDRKGRLYGTTLFGGANNFGTVFEIAPGGGEKVLYSFDSVVNGADGFEPYAGLIEDKGNLYGTTYGGGPDGAGVVFEVAKH